jgi:phosphoenolpyruvate synthase/pyruvate phosphate dikinase
VFKDTLNNKSFVRWETNFSNDADLEEITCVKNMKIEAMQSISRIISSEQPTRLQKMPQQMEDVGIRGTNIEELSR